MTLMTGYDMLAIKPDPSCPGIVVCLAQTTYTCLRPRASTSFLSLKRQDVDGRNKSGHDE